MRPGEYGRVYGAGRTYGGGYDEDGPDLDRDDRSWAARNKSIVAVAAAVAMVLVLVTGGWLLLKPSGDDREVAADGPTLSDSAAGATTVEPTPSPTPTIAPTTPSAPKTTKTTSKVLPKETVIIQPPAKDVPPSQPPQVNCTEPPTFVGENASRADVKAALVAAGNHQYWVGVEKPDNLTVPLPKITVPPALMKAIAYAESSWRSAIRTCDGGIGTMQLTVNAKTNTPRDINLRFGTDYDVATLSGNTQLGAEYIEWLIMFFGTVSFSQNFDLSTQAAVGPKGEAVSLLKAVVAAYNVGPYGVLQPDNTIVFDTKANDYSNNVIALMGNCECLDW